MTGLLKTGFGFWDPIVWLLGLIVMIIAAYLIRSLGEKHHEADTEQATTFFSGRPLTDEHIKAGNVYWGFFEALKKYYQLMEGFHGGLTNDYVYWFVLVATILLIVVTLGGL